MAFVDIPNGFRPVSKDAKVVWYPVATTQTLAKGDMVILSSGQVQIALFTSGAVLGTMAAPSVLQTANTLVPVYVGERNALFEGQCSGTSAWSLVGTAADIEGATGVMEVNEDATTEQVIQIVDMGIDPSTGEKGVGANGRVRFTILRSQYVGTPAAL